MKLKIGDTEYYIKDGIELPSNFNFMNSDEKRLYVHVNGLLHREDGPAEKTFYGSLYWYLNGKLHRIDGPAIIWADGTEWWYLNYIEVDGEIYRKIENSSKEELLVYMIDSEYKDYLPLIEYRFSL